MRRQLWAASTDIEPGDLVVALRDGRRSPSGFPVKVPKKGMFYIITGIYTEWYGLGCTIEGMHAKPYKGFFLVSRGVHYFARVESITEQVIVGESQEFLLPVRIPEVAQFSCATLARAREEAM